MVFVWVCVGLWVSVCEQNRTISHALIHSLLVKTRYFFIYKFSFVSFSALILFLLSRSFSLFVSLSVLLVFIFFDVFIEYEKWHRTNFVMSFSGSSSFLFLFPRTAQDATKKCCLSILFHVFNKIQTTKVYRMIFVRFVFFPSLFFLIWFSIGKNTPIEKQKQHFAPNRFRENKRNK